MGGACSCRNEVGGLSDSEGGGSRTPKWRLMARAHLSWERRRITEEMRQEGGRRKEEAGKAPGGGGSRTRREKKEVV